MNYFIYILCMLPLILIIPDLKKAIDVYDVAIELSGTWVVISVVLSMLLGPVARLTKKPILFKSKRPIGLAVFSWLTIHLVSYFIFSFGFQEALLDLTKPYLVIGLAGFVIFLVMAITSSDRWVKRLGRKWNVIHNLSMTAVGLGAAHALVAQKTIYTVGGQLGLTLLAVLLIRLAVEIVRTKR